jgi:putative endopeptidase
MIRRLLCFTVGLALLNGAAPAQDSGYVSNARGIDPRNFDTTCSPCQDFYQYANGNWLAGNPIPAAYSSWSVWHEMQQRNQDLIRKILDDAAANTTAERGSSAQKIGDFYSVAMDTVKVEQDGLAPLKPVLDRIAAVQSLTDLQSLLVDMHRQGISMLFDMDAEQDLKENEQVIAYATQGGLGLPNRDYYTKSDSESVALREQYVDHMTNMFQLLGEEAGSARTDANTVLAIETQLAEASLGPVELRDPNAFYNIVTLDFADVETPHFSWSTYFTGMGLPQIETFSYAQPLFFARMDSLLAERPIDDWKTYMRWHVVTQAAPYLSSAFVNEDFSFFGTILQGTPELRPRWKRVLGEIDRSLGELLGQLYVKEAFPPEYKERALKMVDDLRWALRQRLENLEWMSDSTKQMALEKWSTFTPKIGYPDKWRDYTSLDIERTSYLDNVSRARAFRVRRNLDKIGKPVDRTEWGMSPQTINAYYNPLLNEIVFPAGILQPPFFDGEADDAVNYGAMGAIIGHEMMHGFDDQGSQFDASGNMKNWWTEQDRELFDARTKKLVDQFNRYEALDGVFVNGELTLGENIADLGGLKIAYAALQHALGEKPVEMIDGFNPEQRFFFSWAQAWRINMRDEAMKLQINTDPHSPGRFRCNGPLSNLEEFRRTFPCVEGNQMVSPDSVRVSIW